MKLLSPLVLFLGLLLFACRNAQPADPAPTLPADFLAFYQRFHQDSLFQMEHIAFPLPGLPDRADSLTLSRNDFRWERHNWRMHRPFDFELGDFRRTFIPFNENMVEERILHRNGRYAMVRRFARMGGEWHLIYYAGLNRLQ